VSRRSRSRRQSRSERPARAAASVGGAVSPGSTTTRGHPLAPLPLPPAAVADAGSGPGDDLAQLHKRRLPLAAAAPRAKEDAAAEEESSVASVESSFVPLEASTPPAPTRLDPNLGLLITTAGFSVGAGGADSENSDDRTSKSSTAASAPRGALPRHEFSFGGFGRERERPRSRIPGGAAHGKNLRAAARVRGASARAAASPVEAEKSLSSVESNLPGSSTSHPRQSSASVTTNGVHKVLFPDDHHSDGEAPSEEARYSTGGLYKQNGSVVGRLVMGNCDSDANDRIFEETSVGKFENGGTHPYVESIALLQSAQETLENGMVEIPLCQLFLCTFRYSKAHPTRNDVGALLLAELFITLKT
jgi:hypothetical protein